MAGRAGDVVIKTLPTIQFILNISILVRSKNKGKILIRIPVDLLYR